MDYEVLNRLRDVLTRAVIAQDTTELWETAAPDCELRGFQLESGDFDEAVAIGGTTGGSKPASLIVRGRFGIGRCLQRVFQWLQAGPAIAAPHAETDLQRGAGRDRQQQVARGAGRTRVPQLPDAPIDPLLLSNVTVTYGRPAFQITDTLYVNEDGRVVLVTRALAPPPPQDAPLQAQWHTERALFFRKVQPSLNAPVRTPPVVDFTFCGLQEPTDMLRFTPSSGKHHKATPIEVKQEDNSVRAEFAAQQGAQRKLVTAKSKEGEEKAYEFELDVGAEGTLGPQGGPNRRADKSNKEDEELKKLSADLRSKYVAEALRLSSNSLRDGRKIVPVLRNLIVDPFLTLTWLDLSCNQLVTVPDHLDMLPLATLYLHGNHLTAWSEVEKLRKNTRLTSLTLFRNPLAEATRDYKTVALGILIGLEGVRRTAGPPSTRGTSPRGQTSRRSTMSPPGSSRGATPRGGPDSARGGTASNGVEPKEGLLRLKSLDFVVLSQVDREITAHHLQRHNGNARIVMSPRGTKGLDSKARAAPPPPPESPAVVVASARR